jgi:hypothetical protein
MQQRGNTVLGRADKSRYEHSGRVPHVDDGCNYVVCVCNDSAELVAP